MLPLLYARENVVISDRSFDAETTAIIGQAFDKAYEEMHDKIQPDWFRESIAKQLIEIAARVGGILAPSTAIQRHRTSAQGVAFRSPQQETP
jgi:hypothetical protein